MSLHPALRPRTTSARTTSPRTSPRTRRRSPATALLAAAGTVLALTAVDAAVLSPPAQAAAVDSAWERLAMCESGGNWSINTGNGYYGGLQFNLATWQGLGLGGYPHQASKSQQIAAANKLHDTRGFQPWPACSKKLGLTGDGSDGTAPAIAVAPAAVVVEPAPVARRVGPRPFGGRLAQVRLLGRAG